MKIETVNALRARFQELEGRELEPGDILEMALQHEPLRYTISMSTATRTALLTEHIQPDPDKWEANWSTYYAMIVAPIVWGNARNLMDEVETILGKAIYEVLHEEAPGDETLSVANRTSEHLSYSWDRLNENLCTILGAVLEEAWPDLQAMTVLG